MPSDDEDAAHLAVQLCLVGDLGDRPVQPTSLGIQVRECREAEEDSSFRRQLDVTKRRHGARLPIKDDPVTAGPRGSPSASLHEMLHGNAEPWLRLRPSKRGEAEHLCDIEPGLQGDLTAVTELHPTER